MEKNRIEKVAKRLLQSELYALQELLGRVDERFEKAISILLDCQGRVHVCGVGKSGIAAKKIAATFVSTGTASIFLHPTEALHGDLGIIQSGDVFISVSNSGETDELLRLIPFLQSNQIKHIAMVGNNQSTLSKVADVTLDFGVMNEGSSLTIAPMASTIASIALGDALAAVLIEMKSFDSKQFAGIHAGGLIGKKLHCCVQDIMQSDDLPLVKLEDLITDVIVRISSSVYGLVPVVDNGQNIIGVITDGDIRRGLEKHPDDTFFVLKAVDLMTKNPKEIKPTASLLDAEELMKNSRITSLVVVDEGRLVGLIAKHQIDLLVS